MLWISIGELSWNVTVVPTFTRSFCGLNAISSIEPPGTCFPTPAYTVFAACGATLSSFFAVAKTELSSAAVALSTRVADWTCAVFGLTTTCTLIMEWMRQRNT